MVHVLGAWTERVARKLVAQSLVYIRMIQALRSVRLKIKRLPEIIWMPGVLVVVLVKERDVDVDVVVVVVRLKHIPACQGRNILRF